MSEYKCALCNKEFKNNWYLKRHLERKTPCVSPRQKELAKVSQSLPKLARVSQQNEECKNHQILPIKCDYCDMTFNHKSSKSKHINSGRCTKIPKKIQRELEVKSIKRQIKKQNQICVLQDNDNSNFNFSSNLNSNLNSSKKNKKVENNFNNCNNKFTDNSVNKKINISNNIQINAFGSENINNISPNEILKCLNKGYLSTSTALKMIHYDIPENRNIFMPNKNQPYVQTFNGKDWIYNNLDKVSDKLSDNIANQLQSWFSTYQQKLKKNKRNNIERLIEDYNNGKRINIFEEEFKLFLLSFSGQIKSFMRDEIQKITANSTASANTTTSESPRCSTVSPEEATSKGATSSSESLSPDATSPEISINNEG